MKKLMKTLAALVGNAAVGLAVLGLLYVPARAQTNYQFPNSPWNGFAPGVVQCGWLYGANMNVTTDQAIPISVPSATYYIAEITITNPSVSLTTAQGGFYQAASKAGTAIVANTQAYSALTTNAANTAGGYLAATLASSTTAWNLKTIYLSLTTSQGSAATADVRIYCRPAF